VCNAISIVAHALREAGIIDHSLGKIEIRDLEAPRATSRECCHAVTTGQEQLIRAPH
jgi:hypothetical protein